jgi:23S rRNA pseudouridine1911/1915/1917 synthase
VGDPTYGGSPKKQLSGGERQRSLAADLLQYLPRQGLHAAELAFVHPITGEERTFTSPIPKDLDTAIARLREFARGNGV